MARRVSWVNNSSGHTGTYVYRGQPLDPQDLPAPVAIIDPVAQGETAEWVDNSGEYGCFAVQDFDGQGVGALSDEVCVEEPAPDYANATAGDEIGGGIYAGIDTIDGTDFYIISGDAASEVYGVQWKTSDTATAGTSSETDGLANTLAMETAGLADHPAAAHCLSYKGGGNTDWHMPARSQVNLMYNNLRTHPEFSENYNSGKYTFTSSEYSALYAYQKRFYADSGQYTNKIATNVYVRPIRRIPV